MEAVSGHPWQVTAAEAIRIQQRLAPLVERHDRLGAVRFVTGTDIAAGSRYQADRPARAAAVTVLWPELTPVEQATMQTVVTFPYVPGLLSFREIPVLLPVLAGLHYRPDLLIVDGQGIAHPRRLGLAAHLGLLTDTPAIGCAKSRLTGLPADDLGLERGAVVALLDRGEAVGAVVRTRTGVRPVYVSTGHRVSTAAAVAWILTLAHHYRLPEPTRLAHLAAAGERVAPLVTEIQPPTARGDG